MTSMSVSIDQLCLHSSDLDHEDVPDPRLWHKDKLGVHVCDEGHSSLSRFELVKRPGDVAAIQVVADGVEPLGWVIKVVL